MEEIKKQRERYGMSRLMELAREPIWSAGAISQPLAAAMVDRIDALEKALVYVAFEWGKRHPTEGVQGVTLTDSATVRVHIKGGITVEVCHDE